MKLSKVTDMYCPSCGDNQWLWVDTSDNDYYDGDTYACNGCDNIHYLDRTCLGRIYGDIFEEIDRLEVLQTKVEVCE